MTPLAARRVLAILVLLLVQQPAFIAACLPPARPARYERAELIAAVLNGDRSVKATLAPLTSLGTDVTLDVYVRGRNRDAKAAALAEIFNMISSDLAPADRPADDVRVVATVRTGASPVAPTGRLTPQPALGKAAAVPPPATEPAAPVLPPPPPAASPATTVAPPPAAVVADVLTAAFTGNQHFAGVLDYAGPPTPPTSCDEGRGAGLYAYFAPGAVGLPVCSTAAGGLEGELTCVMLSAAAFEKAFGLKANLGATAITGRRASSGRGASSSGGRRMLGW